MPVLLRLGFTLGSCPNTGRGAAEPVTMENLPGLPQQFMAFPNPASNKVTLLFEVKKSGKYSLEFYNMQGALLKTIKREKAGGIEAIEWNTSQYTPGIYLVRLITDTGVQTQRVIVRR
jgi:hypothetical protein